MIKNLKFAYIMLFVYTIIVTTFKTLTAFLGGVGLNFVALLIIGFILMMICIKDTNVLKRIWDMLIFAGLILLLELIIFFACEFGYGLYEKGFAIFQNVISIIGFFLLFYIGFRFALDYFDKKLKFIEIMLGNEKIQKKTKKTKEVTNGSLLEKPNKSQIEETEEKQPETEIIIETEE